jgi:hypothetical protein
MQTSVRPSCMAAQKLCLTSNGPLVVAIATRITVSKGQTAKIAKRPGINKVPHTISVAPTNGAIKCGAGIPKCNGLRRHYGTLRAPHGLRSLSSPDLWVPGWRNSENYSEPEGDFLWEGERQFWGLTRIAGR